MMGLRGRPFANLSNLTLASIDFALCIDLAQRSCRFYLNMMEVLLRRDEIVYSERIRNDVRTRNLLHDFHKLVEEILGEVTPDKLMQIKQRPRYIQLMGDVAPIAITRIVREVVEDEPLSKDYDFSAMSIEQHKRSGYNMAQQALSRSPR